MSRTTRQINRITSMIIGVSIRLLLCALLFLLLYTGITRGYRLGYSAFAPAAMEEAPGTDYKIAVRQGESVLTAGEELEQAGLIENRWTFWFQSEFYEYELHPGTYLLNSSMTSKEILRVLDEGKSLEGEQTEGGTKD